MDSRKGINNPSQENEKGRKLISDKKITELYSQGESCAGIAYLSHCSETFIHNKLKSLGVAMRSRSKANQIFPDFIFILLYNFGLSASQVGRLLGVDSSTVIKRLHTLRFPLRFCNVAYRIRYSEKEFKKYFMTPDVMDQLMKLI